MLASYLRRALLCPNPNSFITRATIQTLTPSFSSSIFILLRHFSSSKQNNHSFTVNYLITNCGFSPETATKLATRVKFRNSEKPDSVLALFKSHGFSNSQLSTLIERFPHILCIKPNKTILPKFNFLLSKGASNSDIVFLVTKSPSILFQSLNNTLIPCFDLLKSSLLSDESTLLTIKGCVSIMVSKNSVLNIQFMLQNGIPKSNVDQTLRYWPNTVVVPHGEFKKAVEEVKELGFRLNSVLFTAAMRAKLAGKNAWRRKIDMYKKWGWSDEIIVSAFVQYPWCMLASVNKIEAVMQFFVNTMGWDSLLLAKRPVLTMLSLEKRSIPRAFVLQYLQSRGLIKDAKSPLAFNLREELFLDKFVNRFPEEASHLLKLYEEKRGLPR